MNSTTPIEMIVDLRGKIGNTKLPYSKNLLPLHEAIVNSIQAIEERFTDDPSSGKIEITIDRTNHRSVIDQKNIGEIIGFTVVDNGIGFTSNNFKSFLTSDSTYKKTRGGKGVGRMLWLKAFRKAVITSVFKEKDKHFQRSFDFTYSKTGIENIDIIETEEAQITKVQLVGFKEKYQNNCPKSASPIAKRIIEHCLEFFVLETAPQIFLHDNEETIHLNEIFKNDIYIASENKSFSIGEIDFEILHVMISAKSESDHYLHFCANSRSVRSELGTKYIPNIDSPLQFKGTPFVYAGYVSAQYLNERVMNERTQFSIRENGDMGMFSDQELVWSDIVEGSASKASEFLEKFTAVNKEKKMTRIADYIRKEGFQYRSLLKNKVDRLNEIPHNLSNERLDLELYKIDREYDIELRQRGNELLKKESSNNGSFDSYQKELEKFTEEWNEHGMAKLARHVAYRKATLRFLEERRRLQPNGKYSLEESMHEVIFPLHATSDDVRPDQMNLWILDERLAYHHYLASDMRFDQMADTVSVDSKKRPDLLIFNKPFAFTDTDDTFRSIIIIEFKRPERNDYRGDKPEKNPIHQVYEYVDILRKGEAKDRHGNTINVGNNIPFYAYIVCDITPKLKQQAIMHDFTPTPDAEGFFGYNKGFGVFIEIISFNKLLTDAKKRNEKFFEELGIGRAYK